MSKSKEKKKMSKPSKIILIIISILFIILLVNAVIFYLFFKNTEEKIISTNSKAITIKEETIEYGTHLNYSQLLEKVAIKSDFFENTSLKIFIDDTLIDEDKDFAFDNVSDNVTVKIETICPVISFLNQNCITSKEVVWKVEDTKKPVLSGVADKEITVGDAFDSKAGISAKDEVDGDLEVIIEGEIDVNKAGEYTLTAKAIDKNKNETTQSFKVTVKESPVVDVPNTNTSTGSSNNSNSSNNSSKSSSGSNKSGTNTNSNTSTGNSQNSQNSGSSSSNSSGSAGSSSSANSASTKEGRLALAKAEAKRVVNRIISGGMTKLQKAKAICNYISTTVSVQSNQSNEAYQTNYGNEAYAALVLKIAACSGRCKAVTLLCDAARIKKSTYKCWTMVSSME